MDKHLQQLINVAGNQHKYQIIAMLVNVLFWAFLTFYTTSLGYLQRNPHVHVMDADGKLVTDKTLTYEMCNDYKLYDKDSDDSVLTEKKSYFIVTDKDYDDISWTIEDNFYCEKIKVTVIGVLACLGGLAGACISGSVIGLLGAKMSIWVCSIIIIILLIISTFVHKYAYFCCLSFIMQTCANCVLYGGLNLFTQVIDVKKRSLFNTCINSGMGFGGLIYVLMFFGYKNWKYVFYTSTAIILVLDILCQFIFVDSLINLVKKKDIK